MRRKQNTITKGRPTIHLCLQVSPERRLLSALAIEGIKHRAPESSNQFEFEFAQLFHAADDLVASFEPVLLVFWMAQNHAFRSSGENYVARFESHMPGNIAHYLRAAENEILGIRGLSSFPVDSAFNP